ncbi:MAG: hypothetical protein IKE14_00870 [Loktanella sp.]|nr:hypothetical protein [Loktanella sp.]
MAKYDQVEPPAEILHRADNPDKGGRPAGATDTKPRKPRKVTDKAQVVAKAAKWHVENNIEKLSITVEEFFKEYSQGMSETRRYFRSELAKAISKLTP